MSRTPLFTSTDVNFIVAAHLSNFPLIGTDDSTSNVTMLSPPVISYVGSCCAQTLVENPHSRKTHNTTIHDPPKPDFISFPLIANSLSANSSVRDGLYSSQMVCPRERIMKTLSVRDCGNAKVGFRADFDTETTLLLLESLYVQGS